ncbi:MAG: hypothetical protein ABIG60_03470 [Patescibacteria group bacterium]
MNQTLREMKKVLVKVPLAESKQVRSMTSSTHHMKWIPEQIFPQENASPLVIPGHYHHGMSFPKNSDISKKTWDNFIIVNRHFYGIGENDLGKMIVADIRVEEKTVKGGKKFILLSYQKAPGGTCPAYELKFPKNGKGSIPIPGTEHRIWFKKIKTK